MLTITYLTLKEAWRRRAPIISILIIVLLLVGLFIPLTGRILLLPRAVQNQTFASFYILLSIDMVKFFASILAMALSAGAISAELERGVLSAILPKPIARASVYAGKWLGLFLFVSLNVLVWVAVVWAVASYRAPGMSHAGVWKAVPQLLLYPAMFVTLALMFSTFASFALAGGLAVLATGIGWAEAFLMILNRLLDMEILVTLSRVAGFVMPLGRMSRGVTQGLGPLMVFGDRDINDTGAVDPLRYDLHYVVLYIVVAFVVGVVVLGRRDV